MREEEKVMKENCIGKKNERQIVLGTVKKPLHFPLSRLYFMAVEADYKQQNLLKAKASSLNRTPSQHGSNQQFRKIP